MCVDDSVWVHVGQLDGLPDLALPTHGPSLGDGELDGSGVPPVLLERWAAMLFVISPKCEQIGVCPEEPVSPWYMLLHSPVTYLQGKSYQTGHKVKSFWI